MRKAKRGPKLRTVKRALDVVVVGGGVAGLATARALAALDVRDVAVIEGEPWLASHSSARNAAIWLPVDDDASTGQLAVRSAEILDSLLGRDGWLAQTGAVVTADAAPALEEIRRGGARAGLSVEHLAMDDVTMLAPSLRGGAAREAVHVPGAGELDIHAMTRALGDDAAARGALLRTGTSVVRVVVERDRVAGVLLSDGTRAATANVVIACGAWASELGAGAGAPLPIAPYRRHLVQLECATKVREPVVWHLGAGETYYRHESGAVLASPCDETIHTPSLPPVDASMIDRLANRLTAVAPALASAGVRRAWACLRTFAPDRELVAGQDPRIGGLHWLAGLGGRGMTIGAAAGEIVARGIVGEPHTLADLVSPSRLVER